MSPRKSSKAFTGPRGAPMALTSADDQKDLAALSDALDPTVLLDLTCDLLFIRGHRGIRITDGPGDGARDIHSIDPKDERFITQCKYHGDSDATVGTREMAELPIALLKLDAKPGLFLTNAKISPQAKREYLNDYPNLSLDFLDGLTLVRELRADAILRARWLEGTGLSCPLAVSYPVLVRRHEGDSPIIPDVVYGDAVNENITSSLQRVVDGANVSAARGFAGEEDFGSYREPRRLTQEEGLLSQLKCTLVKLTGLRSISLLEDLQEEIARSFVNVLTPHESRFSVVVGIPSLVPLSGTTSGSTMRVSYSCFATTKTVTYDVDEASFFSLENDKWTGATDARVTEADAIRLYDRELDACLSVTHVSPFSRAQARTNRAIRLHQLEKWKLSVFALLATNPKTLSLEDVPQPDEVIEWPWGSSWLCGWYHPALLGGPIALPTSDPSLAAFAPFDEREAKNRLTKIADNLQERVGVTMLEPMRARHMLAAISYDPFEEEGDVVFRTAELSLGEESGLPSPVLPDGRRFTVTVFLRGTTPQAITSAIEAMTARHGNIKPHHEVSEYKDGYRVDVTLAFNSICDASTPELLTLTHDWLIDLFGTLKKSGDNLSIWTKDAWKEITGVSLGVPWTASDKVYVSIQSKEGVRNLRGIDNPLEQDWGSTECD